MRIKWKSSFLTFLPVVISSYSLDALALERKYEFTSEFRTQQFEYYLRDYNSDNEYSLSEFNAFPNPFENFISANSTISGSFSYDQNSTSIQSQSGVDYRLGTYNGNGFSINLTSEDALNKQFNFQNNSIYTANFTNPEAQSLSIHGQTLSPEVSITGINGSNSCSEPLLCGGEIAFNTTLPLDYANHNGLPGLYPSLFNNVFEVGLRITLGSAESYNLQSGSFSVSTDKNFLPADLTLPNNLPDFIDTTYTGVQLDFNPQIETQNIEVTYIEGDFSGEEFFDKESQINELVSNFYLDTGANFLGYQVTDFSLIADGLTPDTPLLPDTDTTPEEGFQFTFDSNIEGDFTFIDPDVAIGYDYEVISGSKFSSVLLPENIGDNQFDLWLFDIGLGEFVDSGVDITGGIAYDFESEGLSLFRILGIEIDEFLDPSDPFAFVTGLKFIDSGVSINMSQTAITEFVHAPVPVPPSFALFMTGIVGLLVRKFKLNSV